ncbi:hypothetical protein LTR67_002408 [Exophiala xenobiotica]
MTVDDSVTSLKSIAESQTLAQDGEQPNRANRPTTPSVTKETPSTVESTRKRPKKTISRREDTLSDDEPLVDTTAALTLNSKKTARLQKRQKKKQAQKVHSNIQSFLDFPPELISLIFSFLQPSDIYTLLRLDQFTQDFILDNERSIAEGITSRRYWAIRQCFPLPVPLDQVPASARPVLLSQQWQDRLKIHKNPYQHIRQIDPEMPNLENREPLPVIPRGRNPDWNIQLLEQHAEIVMKAIYSPLAHARILQTHLNVTTRTIVRSAKWRKKGEKITTPKPRLYHLTDAEVEAGTDEYLERSGPPSYQPIYMRDNYYSVEAFVPNRKWDKEAQKWQYYSKWPRPHENDLAWLVARFTAQQPRT